MEGSRKVYADSVKLTNVTFADIKCRSIEIVCLYLHFNVDKCQIRTLMNATLSLINIIYTL